MTDDAGLNEAVALLPEWLRHQNWYTGSRTGPIEARTVSATLLNEAEPRLWHVLAEVRHAEGTQIYQVPLSVHAHRADRLDHVHLGHTSQGHVYDALHDKDATAILLGRFADGVSTADGLTFHVQKGATVPFGQTSLVMPGEHHNTSLLYGDAAILKVFRRIEPGRNPDVEIHEALTDAGCELVV